MTYRGHIENGVVVLDEATELPEGASVEVHVLSEEGKSETVGQMLMRFAGKAKGLPSDLARNHDHYLYGVPKK